MHIELLEGRSVKTSKGYFVARRRDNPGDPSQNHLIKDLPDEEAKYLINIGFARRYSGEQELKPQEAPKPQKASKAAKDAEA